MSYSGNKQKDDRNEETKLKAKLSDLETVLLMTVISPVIVLPVVKKRTTNVVQFFHTRRRREIRLGYPKCLGALTFLDTSTSQSILAPIGA